MGEPTIKPVVPAATAAVDTGVDAALAAPALAVVLASLQPARSALAATRAAQKVLEVMVSKI